MDGAVLLFYYDLGGRLGGRFLEFSIVGMGF